MWDIPVTKGWGGYKNGKETVVKYHELVKIMNVAVHYDMWEHK